MSKVRLFAYVFLGFSASTLLTGCSAVNLASPGTPASPAVHGVVHGGQQAVTGATIQLYSVGTTGDASAATALLTSAVQTDSSGNFNITSKYTCPTPTTYVYLTATAGNPGLAAGTNNAASTMMAALGQCGSLNSSTFIFVDEVTTVGSIAALYPYMTSVSHVGSGPGDAAQLASAFTLVGTYTSIAAGTVQGAAQTSIDTLGNIVASCINTAGGVAGDNSACGKLFALATPPAGAAPTDTIGAILNILNNPTLNVVALFNLSQAVAPFQPTLNTAPSNWYMPIVPTYVVSGQVNSNVGCNNAGLNGIAVSINTNPVQIGTTSGNGNFSFANVPNGTYTVTPSIVGPSSAFYPATQSVIVNGSNSTSAFFSANLGYTVSGTVAYNGGQTGQIYLTLNSPCGGGGSVGTSISAKGAFTIRGVAPGIYTLQAFMDNLGKGSSNTSNPSGNAGSVTVSTANVSGAVVTLSDPASVTLITAPSMKSVSGVNTGAIAQIRAIQNSNGIEMATSYTLQWSATAAFTTIAGSKVFPANGSHNNVWLMNGLTDGSVFYFRAYGSSAGTPISPFSSTFGPVTIGAPTGGNSVSGAIGFTGAATGPLFVGLVDQSTNTFYGKYFANPVSAQAYTIQVPNGSNYVLVGIIDQNNDGVTDAGDISNTGNANLPVTVIAGTTANLNLTLPSANGNAAVTTQNYKSTSSGGTSQNYSLNFQVNGMIKQPVAVTLISGPNLINPVDIGLCGGSGSGCSQGFQINFNTGSTIPAVNDSYTFNVTYSDGTSEAVTAPVTAILNALATGLAPTTGTSVSTTPTITWTDPLNASNYTYVFYMNDSNGNTVWQVPGNNSKSIGLTSATTSLIWGIDPTDGTNAPSPSTLSTAINYNWQIQVRDSNGNSAVTQVSYQP